MTLLKSQFIAKKNNTGLSTKWSSLCPIKFKCNLVICLLEQAYRICNSYMFMHSEFQFISSLLLNNGYPRRFIDFQIRKFMNKKHLTQSSFNSFHSQSIPQLHKLSRIFFNLPYTGEPSITLKKNLYFFLEEIARQSSTYHNTCDK